MTFLKKSFLFYECNLIDDDSSKHDKEENNFLPTPVSFHATKYNFLIMAGTLV